MALSLALSGVLPFLDPLCSVQCPPPYFQTLATLQAARTVGRGGIMLSPCPSVCACVRRRQGGDIFRLACILTHTRTHMFNEFSAKRSFVPLA